MSRAVCVQLKLFPLMSSNKKNITSLWQGTSPSAAVPLTLQSKASTQFFYCQHTGPTLLSARFVALKNFTFYIGENVVEDADSVPGVVATIYVVPLLPSPSFFTQIKKKSCGEI